MLMSTLKNLVNEVIFTNEEYFKPIFLYLKEHQLKYNECKFVLHTICYEFVLHQGLVGFYLSLTRLYH